MQEMSNKEYIKSRLSTRALYEQLAEESAELCQAALKAIRVGYQENPTPVTPEQAGHALVEELFDVLIVADVLGLIPGAAPDDEPKIIRWAERLRAKEAAK